MSEVLRPVAWLGGARFTFTPSPAVAHAIRLCSAVAAAILLSKAPGLVENNSSWILVTVLVVALPTTGAALLKSGLRIVGTIAAAATGVLLYGLFAQEPPLLMASLFLVQVVGAYVFTGTRFQYAGLVWAFTSGIVLIDSLGAGMAVETVAFRRLSMICLGILVVFVTESLLWPASAARALRRALAARARLLGEALRRAVLLAREPGPPPLPESDAGALASQLALIDPARSEVGISTRQADALARLALELETLASRARALPLLPGLPAPYAGDPALAAALTALAERLEAALEEIARALGEGREPVSSSEDLEQALLVLAAERDRLLPQAGESATLESRLADLEDVVAVVRAAEEALGSRDTPEASPPPGPSLRLRLDPFRTKIALRAGIAVVACLLVELALGWSPSPLIIPLTFMMAAAPTRGAVTRQLLVVAALVALALLAADLLIVYYASEYQRMPAALAAPLAVVFGAGYLVGRRPELTLIQTGGCSILLLPVFGGAAAPSNVYAPYDTACHVALSVGIGWLSTRLLWPATAARLFRERVALQLEVCRDAVVAGRRSGDASRGERAAGLVRAFSQQSAQLATLHAQSRDEPVERALDETRRARILALATELMDAVLGYRPAAIEAPVERGDLHLAPLWEAFGRLDEALLDSMQIAMGVLRGRAAYRASGLAAAQRLTEDRLQALRADPAAVAGLTSAERRLLLLAIGSTQRLVLRQRGIEDWLAGWQEAEADTGAGRG